MTTKVSIDKIVAAPGFAPRGWQSPAPVAAYPSAGYHLKPPVADSDELKRIIALPYRPVPVGARAAALIAHITSLYRFDNPNCECRAMRPKTGCIESLRLAQAWALHEIAVVGGLLGPIGVGHGKTMLDILAALALVHCRLAVLLVPPKLAKQLIGEYQYVAQHFRVPSLVVHSEQWESIRPGEPVLHVYPYSKLSRPGSTSYLTDLKPDAVFADECHKLRNVDTATTSRFMRLFAEQPETRFCGWTGSMTDSSIKDYSHLAALALRDGSPCPQEYHVIEDWARCLDPGENPAAPGALTKLCRPGEHVYEGYQRRFTETLGVVTATEPAVETELAIAERKPPELPKQISDALKVLRRDWTRPDGEVFVTPLERDRCAHQLACGFYYYWYFPRGEPDKLIDKWMDARKEWHKELRKFLKDRHEHLDSPRLCEDAAIRAWFPERWQEIQAKRYAARVDSYNRDVSAWTAGGYTAEPPRAPVPPDQRPPLPEWQAHTYPHWLEYKKQVEPKTRARRLDPFLAEDAARWGHENKGIIWYGHGEFGRWVAELSDLRMFGGGSGNELREWVNAAMHDDRQQDSIILSIKAHGTGFDGLQYLYNNQLIANPPPQASEWEQMLGRLHRVGQLAAIVYATFYRHTAELQKYVDTAVSRALYILGTMGASQKFATNWSGSDA